MCNGDLCPLNVCGGLQIASSKRIMGWLTTCSMVNKYDDYDSVIRLRIKSMDM